MSEDSSHIRGGRKVGVLLRRVYLSYAPEDHEAVGGLWRQLQSRVELVRINQPVHGEKHHPAYLRLRVREEIQQAEIVLCVIGRQTYRNTWVDWELRTAVELNRPMIGITLSPIAKSTIPDVLVQTGATVLEAYDERNRVTGPKWAEVLHGQKSH